jgi:hypothetical protein
MSYIIKFANQEEYEKNKDILKASSEYDTITTNYNFWVLHWLTVEEYEKIKSHGIHITPDHETISTQ